jgi:hypothetical protein
MYKLLQKGSHCTHKLPQKNLPSSFLVKFFFSIFLVLVSALVMDEVTRDIQGDIPWCMLFADDVVLVNDSRAGLIGS